MTDIHLLSALKLAEKRVASVCEEVLESDLPDWFEDLKTIRTQISIAEGTAPDTPRKAAEMAVQALRFARDCLKVAKAPKALDRVRHAIMSAEGAVRAACYREDRANG